MTDLYHLFERVRCLWPQSISLDVAVTANGVRSGAAFNLMRDLFEAIESKLGDEKDSIELEIWAFYKALWNCAKLNMRRGDFSVSPSEVSYSMFVQRVELELKSGIWKPTPDAAG